MRKQTIMDTDSLKIWFLSELRDLPWRNEPTPYAVLVSEVMLQQTQVSVVVPYFERWMQRFPTIKTLAEADPDVVIKEWEGLGYYSRARNLHQAARYVVETHMGELPSTWDELMAIKGLGPYTVGAILSFAFHKKQAAVDGNVLRVIARYFALSDDIGKAATLKKIRSLAETLLPDEESWIVNEALIELGATICGRTAKCDICPLRATCMAFSKGMTEELPVKVGKTTTTHLYRAVAVISHQGYFLVKKGTQGTIMSDLHEFPYFEFDKEVICPELLTNHLQETWQLPAMWQESLPEVKHSFTRYHAHLFPHRFIVNEAKAISGFEWVPLTQLNKKAFSSGHKRILHSFS